MPVWLCLKCFCNNVEIPCQIDKGNISNDQAENDNSNGEIQNEQIFTKISTKNNKLQSFFFYTDDV